MGLSSYCAGLFFSGRVAGYLLNKEQQNKGRKLPDAPFTRSDRGERRHPEESLPLTPVIITAQKHRKTKKKPEKRHNTNGNEQQASYRINYQPVTQTNGAKGGLAG